MENQLLPRLTLKEIRNIVKKFFFYDRGVIHTYLQFLKQPYKTMFTYLRVDRSNMINPIRFILIAVALDTLIFHFHPDFDIIMEEGRQNNILLFQNLEYKFNLPIINAVNKAQDLFQSYQKVYVFLVIPLLSLITFFIFKKKYNYAENLAINTYLLGVAVWTNIAITLLSLVLFPNYSMLIPSLLSVFTLLYLYKYVYKTSWIKAFLSTFIIWILISLFTTIAQLIIAIFILIF